MKGGGSGDVTGNTIHHTSSTVSSIVTSRNSSATANSHDSIGGKHKKDNQKINHDGNTTSRSSDRRRRDFLLYSLLPVVQLQPISPAQAKCTDLDSCREIGDNKIEQDLRDNPIFKLDSGVRYKILRPGTGIDSVGKDSTVDLAFSVSRVGAGYMFSRGFGNEKIDAGNGKMVSDTGIDSIRIKMGDRNVPLGIEYALIGMKKGERRRVELPAEVGFETSNWQPEPLTGRGKSSMVAYKRILEGYGTTQPGFAAETIWDIEVLRIRK
eukprot:CAMPEP_0176499028 /NCGR_PEP_ID=MMETSP0200_2-20121128/12682_1 /TAXON_ID=947934 /ORGANISM="Chaetoceros sp., Strain GSL56" /LENGTH=266 /DNA_ID=CAMNT_0017897367 /DNA_START=224 /DNA_END=1024 /DNA_ORIENTATION=+